MGDKAEKKNPSVTLTFAQIVGLGLFILGIIGGSVKLLYDAIDKRMERIEEKLDKHDGRLDGITEKVSVQEVRLEHLMQMKAAKKDQDALIASAAKSGDEGSEGSPEVRHARSRRRYRSSSRGTDPWIPRSDIFQQDCQSDFDCPSHHACHSRKCWPPGSGEGGPPGTEPSDPPDEPPDDERMAMAAPEYEPRISSATAMVVEFDPMTRREQRKQARCERRWRRGCPELENPLPEYLRDGSDQLAQMQLRESSDRLAKIQRREHRA